MFGASADPRASSDRLSKKIDGKVAKNSRWQKPNGKAGKDDKEYQEDMDELKGNDGNHGDDSDGPENPEASKQ